MYKICLPHIYSRRLLPPRLLPVAPACTLFLNPAPNATHTRWAHPAESALTVPDPIKVREGALEKRCIVADGE